MAKEPSENFEALSDRRRPRRLEEASKTEISFPLIWIVIGGLAGLMVIGLVGLGVVNLVRQGAITPTPAEFPPLLETLQPTLPPESTSIIVDAPTETPVPSPTTSPPEEVTAEPEATAPPAADLLPIVVDGYVKVINTDGLGLSMRAGPGRNNAREGLAEENEETRLLVLDGPRDDENTEDYVWWFIEHPDGTKGWVVEDFITGVEAP